MLENATITIVKCDDDGTTRNVATQRRGFAPARCQPAAMRPTAPTLTGAPAVALGDQPRGQLITSAIGLRHCAWNAGPFGPVAE